MTLVELFERTPIENMISALTLSPEKIIFVGVPSQMNSPIKRYRRYLEGVGRKCEIVTVGIDKNDLSDTVNALTRIALTEKDCVFDITGGDDLTLFALGTVFEKLRPTRNMEIHRVSLATGKFIDCDGNGINCADESAAIDIDSLVTLFGGKVRSKTVFESAEIHKKAINSLWAVSKREPKTWNIKCSVLKEFEKAAAEHGNNIEALAPYISEYEKKKPMFISFAQQLSAEEIIKMSKRELCDFRYCYRDDFTKECLDKAGNILEHKVYSEVLSAKQNGVPFFTDAAMGVTIDWDGQTHNPSIPETTNEIDVMAMHGITPVFISCKNGGIDEIELYKLNTVAARFGGAYARKVLFATDFSRPSVMSEKAFYQRAADMNIKVVPNAAELSDKEWSLALIGAL